jgi:hypothetical protein
MKFAPASGPAPAAGEYFVPFDGTCFSLNSVRALGKQTPAACADRLAVLMSSPIDGVPRIQSHRRLTGQLVTDQAVTE